MTTFPASICIDCAMLAANGEMPHSDTGNPPDWEPLDRLEADHDVVIGDGEPFFSWGGCDTCTTRLGGDRLDATIITR